MIMERVQLQISYDERPSSRRPLLPPYIGWSLLTGSPCQLIGCELLSSEYTLVTVFAPLLMPQNRGCDRHPKENLEQQEGSV